MADYAKKTVKELQELLGAKGLTISGKKAELIARLQESETAAEEEVAAPAETSIAQTTNDAPPPAADETAPSLADPKTATTTIKSIETENPSPATAQDARESSATTDTKLASAVSYSMNLPTSSLDDEMKKRKARAERFGTSAVSAANGSTAEAEATPAAADVDSTKALERAKRFGLSETTKPMGKLDEALPSERERGGRKRGRGEEETTTSGVYDDPGLRAGRGGKRRLESRGRGRGGRVGGGPDRPQGVVKTTSSAFSSEKDRQVAEARRKKFGA